MGTRWNHFLFSGHQLSVINPCRYELKNVPFDLPKTIIKEGKVDFHELGRTGKDENWLKTQLKSAYSLEVQEILLATVDDNDSLKVLTYK